MSYQLREVFANYLKKETITRLSINQMKVLPKIIIEFNSYTEKIYQKIKHNLVNESKIITAVEDPNYKEYLKEEFFYQFFEKILNERKFEELNSYLNYENQIKSCEIVLLNSKISCPKPQLGLLSHPLNLMHYYFGNLNDSFKQSLHNKSVEKNLEKISFEFPIESMVSIIYIGSIFSSNAKYVFLNQETEVNTIFNSYSLINLKARNYYCGSYSNDRTFYSSFEREFCEISCLIDIMIRQYKCLVRAGYFIDLNKHFKMKNYKFCDPDFVYNKSLTLESAEYCPNKCSSGCNPIYFEIFSKSHKILNSTKLNLIPISSHHLTYIETFKTDINGLIYDLGGVLSLWFGISPVSLVYLTTLFIGFFRKIKQLLPRYMILTKSIVRKFVMKSKWFITICKNLLRTVCIKTIGSLTYLLPSLHNYFNN